MRRLAPLALVAPFAAAGCSSDAVLAQGERVEATQAAVVGGEPSTTDEDFVLYLSRAGTNGTCGASLVAPNLVVTAKHCVYETLGEDTPSICGASGDPEAGSAGGYVTAPIPAAELRVHGGVDAKQRAAAGEAPAAHGLKVVDDKTLKLCSH